MSTQKTFGGETRGGCEASPYSRVELSGFLPSGQLGTSASSGIFALLTKPAAIRQKPPMSKSSTNSSLVNAFSNAAHVERATSACSCNSSARSSTVRSVSLYAWHPCGSRTPRISSSGIPSSCEKRTWLQNTYSEPVRQPIRRIMSSRVRAATLLRNNKALSTPWKPAAASGQLSRPRPTFDVANQRSIPSFSPSRADSSIDIKGSLETEVSCGDSAPKALIAPNPYWLGQTSYRPLLSIPSRSNSLRIAT
jgi:hypothetical protein